MQRPAGEEILIFWEIFFRAYGCLLILQEAEVLLDVKDSVLDVREVP